MTKPNLSSRLPVVDLTPIVNNEPESQWQLPVFTIGEALCDYGFFYVSHHGVDTKLQEQLNAYASKFFALELSKKEEIAMENAGKSWRGYFALGAELTSGTPDQKEGLYFGEEHSSAHPLVIAKQPLHGKNQWPNGKEWEGFRDCVLSYMDSMKRLASSLMEVISLALGLPKSYFAERFTNQPTQLFRIFNYPLQKNSESWGVQEHTDMGFLTLLKQDDQPGLEVKTIDGNWIAAPPIPNTFVVNIGDMLDLWTSGLFRATPHRVKNMGNRDRLSFPYFFDPHWECSLIPIDKNKLKPLFFRHSGGTKATKGTSILQREAPPRAARWDGTELEKISQKMSYGEFVWNKVRRVFPQLDKE